MTRSWHDLHNPDARASLYLRALRKRGISGDRLPEAGLRCFLRVQPDNLAAYRRLCHFADHGRLPPTYPHIMAFTLQLQLLTAHRFPFPLLGLVHLHNEIRSIVRWAVSMACALRSTPTTCSPTPKAAPSIWSPRPRMGWVCSGGKPAGCWCAACVWKARGRGADRRTRQPAGGHPVVRRQ